MRKCIFVLLLLFITVTVTAQERIRTIHVIVALCDNDSQGIVPVPKSLGNGDDPHNNLYWGALYGTKSFIKKSRDWKLVETKKKVNEKILERIIFRHTSANVYLVADAYRGKNIKSAVECFLNAAVGNNARIVEFDDVKIPIGGNANMVAYIGHNGLMDFEVDPIKKTRDGHANDAIVLACKSKPYFAPFLSKIGSRSVLLTTGFMAPEAYTLEAALAGWIAGENGKQIRERAAQAYHKYQKCGIKGARRLFYSE
ncbi:MAG: hypothetical protein ACYSUX_09260 [Planctomycetota bacterium]